MRLREGGTSAELESSALLLLGQFAAPVAPSGGLDVAWVGADQRQTRTGPEAREERGCERRGRQGRGIKAEDVRGMC